MFRLLPINENNFEKKPNTVDNARLDISARRLWDNCEKTFFDVGITHPTTQSYSGKSLAQNYQRHEKEKDNYNQRMIDIEESSLNPLVFTSDQMTPECSRVNIQQMTGWKDSWKCREPYASVMTDIRTKCRFALLRSTLAAKRGFQGKQSDIHLQDLTDIDLSLILRPTYGVNDVTPFICAIGG